MLKYVTSLRMENRSNCELPDELIRGCGDSHQRLPQHKFRVTGTVKDVFRPHLRNPDISC